MPNRETEPWELGPTSDAGNRTYEENVGRAEAMMRHVDVDLAPVGDISAEAERPSYGPEHVAMGRLAERISRKRLGVPEPDYSE